MYFKTDFNTFIKLNVNNLIIITILSQYYMDPYTDKKTLYLMVYYSRKIILTEYNSGINNKEFLIIIHAFYKWCPLLYGTAYIIRILFNYLNL